MPALMATAEYVTKVHAVCTRTGNLAHFSHRTVDDDKLIVLGETQEYQPLSRAAYFKAMQKQQFEKQSAKNIELLNKNRNETLRQFDNTQKEQDENVSNLSDKK
jgi:thymidine kinase